MAGRGRGRELTLPAWMKKDQNGAAPSSVEDGAGSGSGSGPGGCSREGIEEHRPVDVGNPNRRSPPPRGRSPPRNNGFGARNGYDDNRSPIRRRYDPPGQFEDAVERNRRDQPPPNHNYDQHRGRGEGGFDDCQRHGDGFRRHPRSPSPSLDRGGGGALRNGSRSRENGNGYGNALTNENGGNGNPNGNGWAASPPRSNGSPEFVSNDPDGIGSPSAGGSRAYMNVMPPKMVHNCNPPVRRRSRSRDRNEQVPHRAERRSTWLPGAAHGQSRSQSVGYNQDNRNNQHNGGGGGDYYSGPRRDDCFRDNWRQERNGYGDNNGWGSRENSYDRDRRENGYQRRNGDYDNDYGSRQYNGGDQYGGYDRRDGVESQRPRDQGQWNDRHPRQDDREYRGGGYDRERDRFDQRGGGQYNNWN